MARTFHHHSTRFFAELDTDGNIVLDQYGRPVYRKDVDIDNRSSRYGRSLHSLGNGQARAELRAATAGIRTVRDAERIDLGPVRHRHNGRYLQH